VLDQLLKQARPGDPRNSSGSGRHAQRPEKAPGQNAQLLRLSGRTPGQGLRPRKVLEEPRGDAAAPDAAMVIADLGAGEGAFALLLAQQAKKVIAVDTSAKMIEVGRDQALRHGVQNVDFRLGDMEELPHRRRRSRPGLLLAVAAPRAATPSAPWKRPSASWFRAAASVLLDLVKHRFEEARELYADEWLGFSESEVESMLERAGFTQVQTSVVHKEPETPQFQTLLAVGDKPV